MHIKIKVYVIVGQIYIKSSQNQLYFQYKNNINLQTKNLTMELIYQTHFGICHYSKITYFLQSIAPRLKMGVVGL